MSVPKAKYHIANFNWGRLRYPVEDTRNQEFVDLIGMVNKLADEAPGFVWRYTTEGDNSLSFTFRGDPQLVVNFSVWETIEDLFQFAYRSPHLDAFKRRNEWFHPDEQPSLVVWWIEEGRIPTIEDAEEKLSILAKKGPTKDAFTFKNKFAHPIHVKSLS